MFLSNGSFVIGVFYVLMTVATSSLLIRCFLSCGLQFLIAFICCLYVLPVCGAFYE
jgi:hypothetical protein